MAGVRKILIVDDSNDNREALRDLLRFMGYIVRDASNGNDALQIAADFKPDLFILDVMMPGMSGLQVLERIDVASHCYEAIMMTGHESIDDACKAIEYGALSYLRKPISHEELAGQVEKAFRKIEQYEESLLRRVNLEQELTHHVNKAEETFKVAQFQSRRFDLILDNMQEPLLALDSSGNIMMVNKAAETTFDISAGRSLGSPVEQVIESQPLIDLVNQLQSCFTGESGSFPSGTLHYKDRYFTISVSKLIHESGWLAGCVMIFTDITAQYQTEHLRNALFSLVSHEFRTPLTILMNSAALLEMKRHCSDEIAIVHKNITETCGRLAYLVNSVITFALISRQDAIVNIIPVTLDTVLQGCLEKYRDGARQKDIVVTVDMGTTTEKLTTDPELLSAAIECILDNAIKYSPSGGKVEVHSSVNSDNKKQLRIWVTDEGPGIPDDKIATAFDWFTQGEDPLTRNYGGLGLGLPLAKRATQLLGGEISIRPNVKTGSVCEIVLPL